MNNFQRLSVEYDGIYGTIDDYTSDANLISKRTLGEWNATNYIY